MQVKEHCWKWPVANGHHFVKYYQDQRVITKVRFIHDQLEQIDFPYSLPLEHSDSMLIKQVWQEQASSADFSNTQQRAQAIDCLQALHETQQQVNWQQVPHLPVYQLLYKWHHRYAKFLENKYWIEAVIGPMFYTIADLATVALNDIKKRQVPSVPTTLLHGDVVHHNFLVRQDQSMLLIDFDLASLGDPADEMLLWCHRVLPHIEYDVESLQKEHPYLTIVRDKIHYLAYPNELLREAIYLAHLSSENRAQYRDYFMPFAERAIHHWATLSKQL